MKKSIFPIIAIVMCMNALAHAGEFEDRQALARQKRNAAPLAECNAAIAKYTRQFIKAVQIFNSEHPVASVTKCVTREVGCEIGMFWNIVDMGESKNQSFASIKPDNHTSVINCDLRLKNGMICRTEYTGSKENYIDITCIDKAGNEGKYGVSYDAVK